MGEREQSIGGLWQKEDREGGTYLSGEIRVGGETVRVVVFRNGRKQPGEKTPDWRIFPARKREDREEF